MKIALVLLLLGFASAAPPNQFAYEGQVVQAAEQPVPQLVNKDLSPEQKTLLTEELVDDFENEVVRMYTLKTLAEGLKLEEAAEEKIIQAAVETLQEEPSPERTQRLQEVSELLKRDKRAVQVLSGLLGSSSGGGGGGASASASAGSDSGSILSLVGPLLGSSSGGGGGGGGSGGDGASAAAGSDSGSILGLVGPLLGSSSGGGGSSGGDGASASAGSDSGSILGLIGPLLGSSSGGGGAGGSSNSGGQGGVSASAGSDSGSILNLVLPLISSSSSSGGGGGGGSGLGSILSLSSSSKPGFGGGAGGGVAVDGGDHSGGGAGIIGQIKGAKIALVGDKINLLLRAKFGLINKVLTTITNKIAVASLPPNQWNVELKYPH